MLCCGARYFAAESSATAACGGTVAAKSMVGRMEFAGFGATVANIGAYPVQHVR
jgi:hypothetical protein